MKKLMIPAVACLALTACGAADEDARESAPALNAAENAPARIADASAVDFGDDEGDRANDGECDDPRFEGPGMTTTILLDEDRGHDATDCRTAYEAGNLQLREGE